MPASSTRRCRPRAFLATSKSGERFRIDVTFVSDRGQLTTNIAAAVWHWLRGDARTWTAVQRNSHADVAIVEHARWSAAAVAALGIDPPVTKFYPQQPQE